jgi:hypothetical protein
MMEKTERRKLMRKAFHRVGLAIGVCSALVLVAPIFGDKGAERDEEAAAALSSRLDELGAAEKELPAARKPAAGMAEPERAKAADSFFKAGVLCHDIQEKYAEPLGKKADEYLRASLAYRESAIARVYLGSSHIIQARDAKSVMSKVAEANVGLKEVDAAVKSAPEDILVRSIRVECTIGLPEMFKRLDTVSSDLKVLLEAYAKSHELFARSFPPTRVFELKAKELDLRGKGAMADQYRKKAAELAAAEKAKE